MKEDAQQVADDLSTVGDASSNAREVNLDDLFGAPQRPRIRVTLGGAVVLALVAAAVMVLVVALQPRSAEGIPAFAEPGETAAADMVTPAVDASATLLIHVLGAVEHPGVYELGSGARVVDAITAAGGLEDAADSSAINLARVLVDGEQIYVPELGETAPPVPAEGAGAGPAGAAEAGGLVNINSADAAELETLPRIGPAMAQRIIDHRTTNGPFTAVDDLTDVPGIGEATLAGLRDLVTV